MGAQGRGRHRHRPCGRAGLRRIHGTRGCRRRSCPNPVTPISAPSNTGDGLELGLAAGGAVDRHAAVWGVPVLQDPAHVYDGQPSGRMANVELTLPGSIMVNAAGRRFVNEAVNYHDLNKVFRAVDPNTGGVRQHPGLAGGRQVLTSQGIPSAARRSVRCRPGRSAPTPSRSWRRPAGSTRTACPKRWPSSTSSPPTGTTPVRSRDSAADRYLGDSRQPHPCLAALTEGPFHAIPIRPGTWAPAAGWSPTRTAGYWTAAGRPVGELFAAGNVAATVFADAYPGGGATLGSAITRAYAVGRALAETLSPQTSLEKDSA